MSISPSQQKAARIAGLACLISYVTVVSVNFGIFFRLIVRGDPAQTARNVLAHERLFRIGIAGNMVYCVLALVLVTALYAVLKPVGQNLALFAALARLVHGFTWLLVTLNLFTALRLLRGADYTRAFGSGQLPALTRLYLSGFDQYYLGLLFWALASTVGSYLWFQSKYIPRALSGLGVIASAWCIACTLILYIFPEFPNVVNLWWFDSPMAVFEIAVSLLLVFRGIRLSGIAERDRVENAAR